MRYGACNWIFGDTPLPEVAELLSGLGYDGIELFGEWERYPARRTQHILSEHGLSIFSLGPENVDLAHPERKRTTITCTSLIMPPSWDLPSSPATGQ